MPTPRAPRAVDVDVLATLGTAQRRQVSEIVERALEVDDYPNLSEEALLHVHDGDGDPPTAAAGGGAAPSGTAAATRPGGATFLLARHQGTPAPVGAAVLTNDGDAWAVEMVVHPEHRSPDTDGDVDVALLDAALAEAAAQGAASIQAWGRSTDQRRTDATMASRGLRRSRELLQLRVPLTPDDAAEGASSHVPVRPFHPGRDEAAWLEVNRRAFGDHPEQSTWTLDDLVRREREPWFDPQGFLLHEAGGRLAGFCWTKVHRSPVVGEIYVIGVDPDFQGRGLGRALTRAGLAHLAARGITTAMLYVEATNAPALVLYRSLGFTEHHREALYTGAMRHGASATP